MLRKSIKNISGFSLMEVVVATGVSTIVALGSGAVVLQAVKTEQHAQAIADAARAGDILKNVVFAGSNGINNCSNNLQLANNTFDANTFVDPTQGVPLRVQGIPSFGGDAVRGAQTPFGIIEDFRIVGPDANAEYIDIDGNRVISGVVQLLVRKSETSPITQIYLGGIGLKVDDADTLQGCAYVTGQDTLTVNPASTCDSATNPDAFMQGQLNTDSQTCTASIPLAAVNRRHPSAPPLCPVGQSIVLIDRDPDDIDGAGRSESAMVECRDIISPVSCACTTNDPNCAVDPDDLSPGANRARALTGISATGGRNCARLENSNTTDDTTATPTPVGPLPVPPPLPTPLPPRPSPTPFPPPSPTAAPTAQPPAPTPNTACPERTARTECQRICIYEGLNSFIGTGACINYCPPDITCQTPVILPVPTVAPTPRPVVPVTTPAPVGFQCLCGGLIINQGEYCGTCIQEYEPQIGFSGRAYRYIDRRLYQMQCANGSLIPSAVSNPNRGSCTTGSGGRIQYEYW